MPVSVDAAVDRKLIAKIGRYVLVGGSAALTEWIGFAALHFGTGMNYLLSAVLAFTAALAVNYALSLKFVFIGGRHHRWTEICLVTLVSVIGIGINVGVLALLVEVFAVHVMVAKILGTAVAFFWNFFSRHWWVFERD